MNASFGGYAPDGYDHDPLDTKPRSEGGRLGYRSSRLGDNWTLNAYANSAGATREHGNGARVESAGAD